MNRRTPDIDPIAVTLTDITKQYGDVLAVDTVDLSVRPGELLVILGPSGCGKTTTLRLIAGLETPSSGRIEFDETDVTQVMPQDRDLSMVFQNYALYPHKTVRENLAFPLAKMKLTAEERAERISWAASLLEIEQLLDSSPAQLSGGERQRVALGRTIVREPSVFLMDEPLSNLDATLRVNTRAAIRHLHDTLGTTTIYVTHDQEEAMSIADRLAIMQAGTIVQVGPPKTVYTKPANQFVAGFLGDPAIGFLPATTDSTGELRLQRCENIPLGIDIASEHAVRCIGIRPEHIVLGDQEGDTPVTPPLTMTIETIDPLGHRNEVLLSTDETELIGLVEDVPGTVGAAVAVRFKTESILVFDEAGQRIEVEP